MVMAGAFQPQLVTRIHRACRALQQWRPWNGTVPGLMVIIPDG
jgi:hypothetical protein